MNIFQLIGINQSNILIILIVIFVIFLIIRELLTWYWKINKIVRLLEQIEENTRLEIIEKKTEVVLEQKPQTTVNKDPISQTPRNVLDKWWNGPGKYSPS